jgi:hypothetical protein
MAKHGTTKTPTSTTEGPAARRRTAIWKRPTVHVVVVFLTLIVGCQVWIESRYVSLDEVQGLTTTQIREKYGEPDWVIDNREVEENGQLCWAYYHAAGGNAFFFEDDLVVAVGHKRN